MKNNSLPIGGPRLFLLLNDLPSAGGGLGACASSAFVLRVALDGPVENVVVLESLANKEVAEQLAEVRRVGLVVKAKSAAVVEEDSELAGEPTEEEVVIFFSMIRSYFCFLVAALRPCQGSWPRRKYIKM